MPYDESVGANETEMRVEIHVVQGSNPGTIPEKRSHTVQYCGSCVRKRLVK